MSEPKFKPFVRRIGEHLNGYAQPCMCTTAHVIAKPQPKVRSEAEPKKVTRVPTWEDHEQADAERRGYSVHRQSMGGIS
jgi:hypothetical protein